MTNTKRWFQSRTLWTNGIIVILAALGVFIANGDGPITGAVIAAALTAALNVVLRLTTSSGIAGFAPAPMRAPRSGTSEEDAPTPDVPDRAPSLAAQIAADNGIDPEDHSR